MTEKDTFVAMARRLEAAGLIEDVEYPDFRYEGGYTELSYLSNGWHGYAIRFRFNDAGQVIETAAGC